MYCRDWVRQRIEWELESTDIDTHIQNTFGANYSWYDKLKQNFIIISHNVNVRAERKQRPECVIHLWHTHTHILTYTHTCTRDFSLPFVLSLERAEFMRSCYCYCSLWCVTVCTPCDCLSPAIVIVGNSASSSSIVVVSGCCRRWYYHCRLDFGVIVFYEREH